MTLTFVELQRDLFLGQDADEFINSVLFPLSVDAGDYLKKEIPTFGLFGSIREILESESDEETLDFYANLLDQKALEAKELSTEEYLANPYAKLLSGLKKGLKGDIRFGFDTIPAYSLFASEDKYFQKDRVLDVSPLGYFTKDFLTPTLKKKGRTWMSLVPHEINTMKEPIAKARGKVATLGLGLGYYAFMASQKEEVDTVEVYEKDKNVIAFFKETLLPLFPNKEKIIIRQADAFSYVNNGPYDYVFADLWHNADDGLPLYIKLKSIEKEGTDVDYWIENAILAYARRFLIHFLYEEEEIERLEKELPTRESQILQAMKRKLEGKNHEDILSLFYLDSLKKFLGTLI